jgi:amino acid transporter
VTAPGNGSSGRFQAQAGPLAVVGLVYAAACGGPYGTEDYVASTGPGLMILLLFLAPWLWGVPIALATAELSSLLPIEGGYYRWTRVILGDFWGFQAGALSLMSSCLDNALYPVLFAKALPLWFPGVFETGLARWLAAVGFIAMLTALNLRGIKLVGGTAVGLNLFLMAPLIWFIVAAAFNVRHHPFVPFALSGTRPLGGLGAGLALAIWFYSGYTEISTVCEEIRQPSRTIPLALLIVTPLVVLSYALPTMAGLAVDDGWQAWAAGQFAVIGERLGGKLLGHWLFLASVASFTVIFMSYLLLWSRLGWALAADHKLPSVFARLHPRYGTPYRILMVYAVVYAALAVLSFERLLEANVWVFGAYDLLLLAAAGRGRRKLRAWSGGFRIPGGKVGVWINTVVPALTWLVVVYTTAADRLVAVAGTVALLLPSLIYLVMRAARRHKTVLTPC